MRIWIFVFGACLCLLGCADSGSSSGASQPTPAPATEPAKPAEPAGKPEPAPTSTQPTEGAKATTPSDAPKATAPAKAEPKPSGATQPKEPTPAPSAEAEPPAPAGSVQFLLELKVGQKINYLLDATITRGQDKKKLSMPISYTIKQDTGLGYVMDFAADSLKGQLLIDKYGEAEWKTATDGKGTSTLATLTGAGLLLGIAGMTFPEPPVASGKSVWQRCLPTLWLSSLITNGREVFNPAIGPKLTVRFKKLEKRGGKNIAILSLECNEKGEIVKGSQRGTINVFYKGTCEAEVERSIPILVKVKGMITTNLGGKADSFEIDATTKLQK
jgi:hypothetical protein